VIHQLIFAHPRPGMSEQEFQRYWVEVHAVRYASKIPQIKRYLIDTRIPFGPEPDDPLFSGIAEIWLENEEDQLASLQSKEFLEGARVDEPRWAAFWRTIVLDTSTHVLLEGPPAARDSSMVKLIGIVKRKPGMPLEEFRRYSLEDHARLDLKLPGLRRYWQCHVRDSSYAIGEAVLDSAAMLWFDDVAALEQALNSPAGMAAAADLPNFIEPKYAHTMVCREHWIIGPEPRR
jgi:uncharacterized protein (TIGR02118 family)